MTAALVLLAVSGCGEPRFSEGTGSSSIDALSYTCGGSVFPVERLESPLPDEDVPEEAWAALRRESAGLEPELGLIGNDDWNAVLVSDERITFLLEKESRRHPFSSFTLESSNGEWSFASAGDCRPSAIVPGREAAEWRVLEEPKAADRALVISATEMSCSSGRELAPDAFQPRVEYESDRILIALFTEPVEGAANCISNPSTRVTLTLDEAIGDRAIYDAGFYPFRRR